MKFESGGFYKHNSCSDTFIDVLKVQAYANYTLLDVYWWTQGTSNVYRTVNQLIKIDEKDYKDWGFYEPK